MQTLIYDSRNIIILFYHPVIYFLTFIYKNTMIEYSSLHFYKNPLEIMFS